jgi:hypothetical protein
MVRIILQFENGTIIMFDGGTRSRNKFRMRNNYCLVHVEQ